MTNQNSHTAKWGLSLLLLSAPCWWIGAFGFFPFVGAVYDAQDSTVQLRIIRQHPIAWNTQNLCFLVGVLATLGGLAIVTTMLRENWPRRLADCGLVTMVVASVLGIAVLYRAVSVREWLTAASPPMYSGARNTPLHTTFGVVTLVGFILYGLAFISLKSLKWTGAVAITLSAVMLDQVARHRDAFPPLFFYTVPFIFGVRLLSRLGHRGSMRLAKQDGFDAE